MTMTVWPTVEDTATHRRDAAAAQFAATTGALRRLDPESPRVYAVADMASQTKRRWWALADGVDTGRLAALYERALVDHPRPDVAVHQVATALIHAVAGRVSAAYIGCGRAWDPGRENLWIHLDSDVGIDWAGVVDPELRAVADPIRGAEPGVVTMPCEDALVVWIAHRAITSLDEVERGLAALGPLDARRFRRIVGECILGTSAMLPLLGAVDRAQGWRRGQRLLDAFVRAGYPVRGRIVGRDLGQPFLYSRTRPELRIARMS